MRKKIGDVRSVMDPVQPNAAAARLLIDVLEEGGAGSVLAAATTSALQHDLQRVSESRAAAPPAASQHWRRSYAQTAATAAVEVAGVGKAPVGATIDVDAEFVKKSRDLREKEDDRGDAK
ncbi:hypothetical protein SASPL_104345 [Salvia splendens]|uniref:Uncharacterized protein n=1 Tax=Salvia splendens TaxID=180675 RepID=A0A8X8YHD5_SALSN|nr:hypothetical protein SASPL_104345 [Salvia splendens]